MKACEFAGLIHECSSEVLDTMYFTTVLSSPPSEATMSEADELVSYNLQFEGHLSGYFGLHLNWSTARTLAANFLGEEVADVTCTETNEVVGELANILCGAVMSRVKGEHPFVLSHPLAGSRTFPEASDSLACVIYTDSGNIEIRVVIEGNL